MGSDSKLISQFSNVPDEFRSAPRWVLWQLEDRGKAKPSKVPYSAKTGRPSNQNPDGWCSFAEALAAHENNIDLHPSPETLRVLPQRGIGFQIKLPYIGIDLDHVRNPKTGDVEQWAVNWIKELNSYTELSPSTTGFHVWLRCDHPPKDKKGVKTDDAEIYADGRYFTMGEHWPDSPLKVRSIDTKEAQKWFQRVESLRAPVSEQQAIPRKENEIFALLMKGEWEQAGFTDRSRADLRFCGILVKKFNGDRVVVDETFRCSGMMRKKWDEKRGAKTYGEMTIDAALRDFNPRPEDTPRSPLVFLSATELLKKKYKPREPILVTQEENAVFQIPSINQVHAFRGVGKTYFGLGLACAFSTGGKFLAYQAPRPFKVLYIEGELPGSDLQERISTLVGDVPNFTAICYEDQADDYRPPLSDGEGRKLVEEAIRATGTEIVFFDSISSLANLDANKEESWLSLCEWFMKLRKMGLAVIYLQHDGKTGLQRGHSKHEDFIDRSAWLRWEDGYEGEQGLKCILGFDKNRPGPLGKYARLSIELDRGTNEWTYAEAKPGAGSRKVNKGGRPPDPQKEEKLNHIQKLLRDGVKSWNKIAEEVGARFGCKMSHKTAQGWYEEAQKEKVKEQMALTEVEMGGE